MNRYPPISLIPVVASRRPVAPIAVAPIAVAAVAVVFAALALGCEPRPPAPAASSPGVPSVAPSLPGTSSAAGLLVADGGPIRITDANAQLVDFGEPTNPVDRVSAAGGTVVALAAGGVLLQSRLGGSDTPSTWQEIRASIGPAVQNRFAAVAPSGLNLVVATGELQARSFELVVVDLATDTSRSIRVDRGLNGSPAWLGPGRIAIDATRPNGAAELVLVDPASGGLSVPSIVATAISATPDGRRLAVDDPTTGDVLVGDTNSTGVGWAAGGPSSIQGSDGAGVESLALSAAGNRLAVVRRTGDHAATIVLLAEGSRGWAAVGSVDIHGDHAVSIAWLR
jgi:hypothetical protein